MTVLALALFTQLAVVTPRPVQPVLAFPERSLDDTTAYRGYQTRFFRDAARNTIQVYLDERSARVVHLMADADNASIGFTARDDSGRTAALAWASPGASVSASGRTRRFEHRLTANTNVLHLGAFLLGSMRVERDFQYFQKGKEAFASGPYAITEVDRLITTIAALPIATQPTHLRLLNAASVNELRSRMYPRIALTNTGAFWVASIQQVTLDARDTLTLELRAATRDVNASVAGDSLTLGAKRGESVAFGVRISTTAKPLTPLTRAEIFTPEFLAFLEATRARGARVAATDTAAIRARRMERQVRGVELLVSREKLMAGLSTYATYFGRDMLMTALMMQPIWKHATLEAVIAVALRKLGPNGDISHEEALGDQATRESAGEYADLIAASVAQRQNANQRGADSLFTRAEGVLRTFRNVRENYHMIDDEYQFAIVVARWITDPTVSAESKRAFLLDSTDGGGTRVARIMSELTLLTRLTAPYAANPIAANLIAFAPREPSGFATASWRDSGAGYAAGKYAMDINCIWVPHALEATGQIIGAIKTLLPRSALALESVTPLNRYIADAQSLSSAITTWRGATRHFTVTQTAAQVQAAVNARLAAMPAIERSYWQGRSETAAASSTELRFLAVALDAAGTPIRVANTDPATQLFLGDGEGRTTASTPAERAKVLDAVRLFVRPYPAGLFVDRIGPVVANDAYTTPGVWDAFVKDPYHGPRVVWGREVNLFLLGVANRIAVEQRQSQPDSAYITELRDALMKIRTAVEQSGFHTELWAYTFENGTLGAQRYGSGADVQLWSTTDLAVQFVLARAAERGR